MLYVLITGSQAVGRGIIERDWRRQEIQGQENHERFLPEYPQFKGEKRHFVLTSAPIYV